MNNILFTEGISDTVITYMIIKKLLKPYKEWDAYGLGLISKEGKKLKDPKTSEERESWNSFERLMWRIRSIMEKFIGQSKLAKYFTIAYLLKDSLEFYVHDDKFKQKYLVEMVAKDQLMIYNIMEELNKTIVIAETDISLENDLKIIVNKYYRHVEKVMENYTEQLSDFLIEDSVAGDIALADNVINKSLKKDNNVNKRNKIRTLFTQQNKTI